LKCPSGLSPPKLFLVLGTAAVWLSLGRMESLNHADTLVPVLASLYHWTWFYWGQNRLGMPVALVAGIFKNPLDNLIFQTALCTFFALGGFALIGVLVAGWRCAALSGLTASALFILWAGGGYHLDHLLAGQSYGLGLFSGILGLLVAEGAGVMGRGPWGRRLAAGLLFFMSLWANLAVAMLLIPLAALRSLPGNQAVVLPDAACRRSPRWDWLPGMALAFALNLLIAKLYHHSGNFSFARPGLWLDSWVWFARNVWGSSPAKLKVVFLSCAAAAVVTVALRRSSSRPLIARGAVVVVAAVVYLAAAGVTNHARESGLPVRYAIPAVCALFGALVATAVGPWVGALGRRRILCEIGLAVALLAAATFRYGLPSRGGVREILDRKFGSRTADIIAGDCRFVLGDYWDVWESVFHANLVLFDSGSSRTVWGLANRASDTEVLWRPLLATERIAVPATDRSRSSLQWVTRYLRLPALVPVEERQQVTIYRALLPVEHENSGRRPPSSFSPGQGVSRSFRNRRASSGQRS